MPAHSPMARARSFGGNVTVRMDSVPGISSAAPMPWMARKAISWPGDCDSPHASDAPVKTARPVRNILLRP